MANITGTAGNDSFVAHTDLDYSTGQLVLVLGGMPADGEWPRPNILVNGVVVANVTVNAYVIEGYTQVVTVPLPDGPVTSVGIQYWNDTSTPDGQDRNLYVGSVSLNGVDLPITSAIYARDGDTSITGQNGMDRNGTMTWSGTVVANAMAQPRTAPDHVIDAGDGMDTVVYTGREHPTFEFLYHTDGAMTVHHYLSGFTDALWHVENVLFDEGGNANVDAPGRIIDGGAGLDTLVLNGHRDQYHITHTSTGFSIDGNGVDEWVTNVERLQFTNGYVALDVDGHGGQAYRLYQAAFNRVPDVPGLGYQMNALDTQLTLPQVAANFIASPEFQATYGNVDDTQFVTLLYRNVLHRDPEAAGLQFHLDELHSGQSRADVLTHFSESPENQANVIGQIQDGMFYTL